MIQRWRRRKLSRPNPSLIRAQAPSVRQACAKPWWPNNYSPPPKGLWSHFVSGERIRVRIRMAANSRWVPWRRHSAPPATSKISLIVPKGKHSTTLVPMLCGPVACNSASLRYPWARLSPIVKPQNSFRKSKFPYTSYTFIGKLDLRDVLLKVLSLPYT
jgi:hypothetical protein